VCPRIANQCFDRIGSGARIDDCQNSFEVREAVPATLIVARMSSLTDRLAIGFEFVARRNTFQGVAQTDYFARLLPPREFVRYISVEVCGFIQIRESLAENALKRKRHDSKDVFSRIWLVLSDIVVRVIRKNEHSV